MLFLSLSPDDDAYGALIDNVSVVPETSTLAPARYAPGHGPVWNGVT